MNIKIPYGNLVKGQTSVGGGLLNSSKVLPPPLLDIHTDRFSCINIAFFISPQPAYEAAMVFFSWALGTSFRFDITYNCMANGEHLQVLPRALIPAAELCPCSGTMKPSHLSMFPLCF